MILNWLLSLFPILLILFLMLKLRWGVVKVGAIGWFGTLIIAYFKFGAGFELLSLAQMKSLLISFDVLLIIWTAYIFFQIMDEAGTIKIICDTLIQFTPDQETRIFFVGFIFASFLQSIGGFGVPIAITAPMLVILGLSPITAVALPSLGCAWAVTFGSFGLAFQTLLGVTGLPANLLAPLSAGLLGIVAYICALMVLHLAQGWVAVQRMFWKVFIIVTVMILTQYLFAITPLWNIAGVASGIMGLIIGLVIVKYWHSSEGGFQPVLHKDPAYAHKLQLIYLSIVGFFILIVITIGVELVPDIRAFLSKIIINIHFPEMKTALGFVTPAESGKIIILLSHPSAILGYTSLLTYVIYKEIGLYKPGSEYRIVVNTIKAVIPTSIGIISMVAIAMIMTHAGMIEILARGLAEWVPKLFIFTTPWIGAIGAFITGSNTNSNLIFAVLQQRTAELLGLSIPWILAAQTAGGSVGCSIAPTRIIVGTTTVGIVGQEGAVLRKVFIYMIILISSLSFITFILSNLSNVL